ncbi:hypothetical protein T4A_11117 [Trichinella pseudospiralis]|uniref:Uncharacterized protein n=1 Tax=Trichinella pseudospiralis TaxID=6337 RepID=A0A0V1ECV9_TRIPS|nr:hypothetical protein T4A_11117 [Trichinella pseudospiralis]
MKQEVRWKYHTTSGNSEDKTCLNLCDDVLITFHKITNFIIHLISSVMEDYDASICERCAICQRKVEICLEKRMMIYFELQAMHSSHMQAEALMGYLGFCIRHVKSEYSSCRIVVKVYKHISIQSNGIEDREFNSNRGIHHLFFTVKNFYKDNVQNEKDRISVILVVALQANTILVQISKILEAYFNVPGFEKYLNQQRTELNHNERDIK